MDFELVFACDDKYGIGKVCENTQSTIPWKIPEEMKFFRETTKNTPDKKYKNAIIMGRITADTIPKALPDRVNIVITSVSNYRQDQGFISFKILDDALVYLSNINKGENEFAIYKVYVIGGAVLADSAIDNIYCRGIYLNVIHHDYQCNVLLTNNFITKMKNKFKLVNEDTKYLECKILNSIIGVSYYKYTYYNNEEIQYINLIQKILSEGDYRETRNAKTYSIFGEKLVFDLDNGIPILTSKKMFTRGIIEELLFMLNGYTNTKILEDKKVMIWHDNTTKEFIEKNKKNLEEYDMGPMYGFQWRHFGATYEGANADYENKGVDQLKSVVDTIVNDPHSRRILMTCYNPSQAEEGVLYPCHGLVIQFYLEHNRISLQMYQRSVDTILGMPFNIASYAIMLHIITMLVNNHPNRKHEIDYKPGRVIMVFGDTHIYSDEKGDHVETAREILKRRDNTYQFPQLRVNYDLRNSNDLKNIESKHFEIIDYVSCGVLKANMIA